MQRVAVVSSVVADAVVEYYAVTITVAVAVVTVNVFAAALFVQSPSKNKSHRPLLFLVFQQNRYQFASILNLYFLNLF